MMIVENVAEFTSWGPLMRKQDPVTGEWCWVPNPAKAGQFFRKFVRDLQAAGYHCDWSLLNAANYGSPTTRKRFFLVARRDGQPIVWPEPTHGPGRARPWRTAAECIDWSIPMQSIFDRPKPLAEATQRRIAAGFVRYVLGIDAKPADKISAWVERMNGTARGESLNNPLSTVTAQGKHHALCLAIDQQSSRSQPIHPASDPLGTVTTKNQHALVDVLLDPAWIAKNYTGVVGQQLEMPLGTVTARDHHSLCIAETEKESPWIVNLTHGGRLESAAEPMRTITAAHRGEKALCASQREASWMIQTGYGERQGQAPRVLDLNQPLGTVVAGGGKHALCQAEAFVMTNTTGHAPTGIDKPLPTVTSSGNQCLVDTAKGPGHEKRQRVVRWVERYYSHGGHSSVLELPLPTVTTKSRMALIEARIEDLQIVDILFRMFQPRELATAMGFDQDYILVGTKEQQIARIGNAVCPQVVEAILNANLSAMAPLRMAA
jgi:DNA (cytosine-5)-methyltransferase 1